MLANLKGIFSPQAVASTLENLPDLATTVLDSAFPARPVHPFPVVGVGELTAITGTVPVVRRGGQPVTVGDGDLDVMLIAPQPIKPAIEIAAAELNDLKMLTDKANGNAVEMWRRNKIDALRRLVRDTTEAMASIVLYQGKVDWPSRQDGGGMASYVVDYGKPLTLSSFAPVTGASKISEIYGLLLAMRAAIRQHGIGGKIALHAGSDVFAVLMDVCQNYASTAGGNPVRVELSSEQGAVVIGGFTVALMDETYKDPQTGQWVDKLAPKALAAYAVDAPGKVYYCAIDSISAANAAVPFHVVSELVPGDGAVRLIAQSKPLPARNPKTVCIVTAVK